MSNTQEELLQLAELDEKIALGSALFNLERNLDFRKLVSHYTEKMPLDLTYSLARIDKDSINTDNVVRRLESIALFRSFLEELKRDYEISVVDRNNLLSNGANHK